MPPHRSRSLRARLLSPVALGIVLYLAVGSLAAGSAFAPSPLAPAGAVAGAIDHDADLASGTPPAPQRVETTAEPEPLSAPFIAVRPDPRDGIADPPPPVASLVGYRWPLQKGRLTQPFGPTRWGSRVVDGASFHDGIDLATFCGDRVVAAHDGIVLAAGRHYDDVIGWLGDLTDYYRRLDAKKLWSTLPIVVVIDDGNGYRSMYAHFQKVVVKPGRMVHAGDLLGYEGRTGHATGCHVHYGLFSPLEPTVIAIEPGVARRMKLPSAEIARIDPMLVLPDRRSAYDLRRYRRAMSQ